MRHTRSQGTIARDEARHPALKVLFLAGGNGLAANLAAQWTKFLVNGCLEVEAAGSGGTDLTAALNDASAGLVVVIHAPGSPGPLVTYNCGGRIDWNLEFDLTGSPFELTSQVRGHVMQLLGDIGMARVDSDVAAAHPFCPSTVRGLSNRLDAAACRLAA